MPSCLSKRRQWAPCAVASFDTSALGSRAFISCDTSTVGSLSLRDLRHAGSECLSPLSFDTTALSSLHLRVLRHVGGGCPSPLSFDTTALSSLHLRVLRHVGALDFLHLRVSRHVGVGLLVLQDWAALPQSSPLVVVVWFELRYWGSNVIVGWDSSPSSLCAVGPRGCRGSGGERGFEALMMGEERGEGRTRPRPLSWPIFMTHRAPTFLPRSTLHDFLC